MDGWAARASRLAKSTVHRYAPLPASDQGPTLLVRTTETGKLVAHPPRPKIRPLKPFHVPRGTFGTNQSRTRFDPELRFP